MTPPRAAGLRAGWPLVASAGAGAVAALGQAPWGLWGAALAGLAVAIGLIGRAPDPRAGFWRGWAAGFGMFALAMSWITEPFFIEADRHAWMAPFALALLPGGLALFWAGAGWLTLRLFPPGRTRCLALALALTGAEALRGWVFGGFPWAMPGHVWVETPLAQVSALTGPVGLTLLTLVAAAGLAALIPARAPAADPDRHPPAGPSGRPGEQITGQTTGQTVTGPVAGLLAAGVPLALIAAGWVWGQGQLAAAMPPDRDLRVRLVQPNADQALKWQLDWAEYYFFRHLDLTAQPPADGRAPDLVLWPETAVPFYLESPGDGLTMAAAAAGGAMVVMGIQRQARQADGGWRYFNSLAALDAAGLPVAVYDKHHLVPFGEYVPLLGAWADRPGLRWLTAFVGTALLGYTPGPGPAVLDLGRAGRVLPLICYEAVFPRHLRLPERPDWVLQLTNDAWFGLRSGPFQHLALARLRAIEQGLPLIRVANTGVSAVIDARGRVVQDLALGAEGVVDADLPGALPATPYARTGDAPWHLGLALALALLALPGWRARRPGPPTPPGRPGRPRHIDTPPPPA